MYRSSLRRTLPGRRVPALRRRLCLFLATFIHHDFPTSLADTIPAHFEALIRCTTPGEHQCSERMLRVKLPRFYARSRDQVHPSVARSYSERDDVIENPFNSARAVPNAYSLITGWRSIVRSMRVFIFFSQGNVSQRELNDVFQDTFVKKG
ncbi:hypothetical protein EDB86DRAFT_1385119 [Lactarius hatsudake]|nr:hypothetical protein EDB86DRAFT_1385119 [Lactarius hatsudake]